MSLFAPSRDQARAFMAETWRKHRDGLPLEGAETTLVKVLLRHPEYHPLLEDPQAHLTRDWLPEHGETNPFLHLSLHLAIEEQVSIDQPPGIRAAMARLRTVARDDHDALHLVMECLAEEIWHTQRHGVPFDASRYRDALDRRFTRSR
ncbi:MAG: DUF1841 family protein [Burkholderiales bacterium]